MQRRDLFKNIAAFAAPLAGLPLLAAKAAAAQGLPAHDQRIQCFSHSWLVAAASEWKTEATSDGELLRLAIARPQEANPRAPVQYALLDAPPAACFTLDVEVSSDTESASLIVVYAWRDPTHFNYIHLSTDSARAQPVHNGVFHVYGGDRVRISGDKGPAALASSTKWTQVRIVYDGATHLVETWIEGQLHPSLRAVDFSLGAGSVGLGSFFNTGSFRKLNWKPGVCRPA